MPSLTEWVMFGKGREKPEPCTDEAYGQGCTCSIPPARSNDIDPPEPKADADCPLHGFPERDWDAARERRLERDDYEYDSIVNAKK